MTNNPLLQLTRRTFLQDCGVGTGKVALASLLSTSTYAKKSWAEGQGKTLSGQVKPHHQQQVKRQAKGLHRRKQQSQIQTIQITCPTTTTTMRLTRNETETAAIGTKHCVHKCKNTKG